MRKAIGLSTVTLHVKEYKDDEDLTHIDIEQTATGGIKGTTELRILDNKPREHEDHIFGRLCGRSRWLKSVDEIEDSFQKEGWEDGTNEFVMSHVTNDENGWTAVQVWGFEVVNEERRYSRHIVVTKGKEVKKIRLLYDFLGKRA